MTKIEMPLSYTAPWERKRQANTRKARWLRRQRRGDTRSNPIVLGGSRRCQLPRPPSSMSALTGAVSDPSAEDMWTDICHEAARAALEAASAVFEVPEEMPALEEGPYSPEELAVLVWTPPMHQLSIPAAPRRIPPRVRLEDVLNNLYPRRLDFE
jgi:hypothetical protein